MEQNAHNSIPATDLRMPEIKTYLYETAGRVIEAAAYKFKKSKYSFSRKHGKDYEEIYFLFYNYFPVKYQSHFSLFIWNAEIQNIKSAFPYQQNIDNFAFSTLHIPMGIFVDEERIRVQIQKNGGGFMLDRATGDFVKDESAGKRKDLTWAQIAGHSCEFATSKDLFEGAEEMKKLLEEKVLPLSRQLSMIDGIDAFFTARPGWSVKSLSLNHFASELIAAKLNGMRDYHEVFRQIAGEVDKRILNFDMSPETRKVLEEIYKYLQEH